MKFLPVIFAVASFAFIQTAEAKFDKEKRLAVMKKCRAETKINDIEYEAIKRHEIAESKEGKCFTACCMNSYGMMKDGKPNLEKVNEFFETALEEQEKRDRAIKVAAGCVATEDVKDLDECETAYKYCKCVKTHSDFADLLSQFDF